MFNLSNYRSSLWLHCSEIFRAFYKHILRIELKKQDCLTDPRSHQLWGSSLRVEQLHIAILSCPGSEWALQIIWSEWFQQNMWFHAQNEMSAFDPNGVWSFISHYAGVTAMPGIPPLLQLDVCLIHYSNFDNAANVFWGSKGSDVLSCWTDPLTLTMLPMRFFVKKSWK